MSLRLKIELAVGIVILALALIGGYEGLQQHDARIRAEASVLAQKELQADYQRQVSELAKQMSERDATYRTEISTLNTKFQAAATPTQLAALISQVMGLKQPIQISTPAPTAQDPHPTPVVQVPEIDFPQAKQYVQSCEECKLDKAKLVADAADRQAQQALAQKEIDSLKKSNASLETAVKGGNWIQRLGRATKYLIIGGAAALVATCATGHCK